MASCKTGMTAAVLLLFLVTAFVVPPAVRAQAATSSGTANWWDSSYPFRVGISLTNPYNHTLADSSVLVEVPFPMSHLLDAGAGLRLTTQNGTEVPSYVVDENKSGEFVTSVWLLVIATLGPSTVQEFWLYYGNPLAQAPSYRIGVHGSGFSSGLLSVAQESSGPGSLYYGYTYGRTFSESVLSRVSYGSQGENQFGTVEISSSPLMIAEPLRVAANLSSVPLMVTEVTSSAPDLRVIQLDTLSASTVLTNYLIENSGQGTLSAVNIARVFDSSQLAALAPATTSFAYSNGSIVTRVGSAYVGSEGSALPVQHGVGPIGVILNQTKQDLYNLQNQAFGKAGGALSWDLGTLGPGQVFQFSEAWGVSNSSSSLASSLNAALESPSVSLGQEETVNSLVPTASIYWGANINLKDVVMGARGPSFPMTIQGGVPLADSASFSGTITYFTPSPDFAPAHSGVWATSSGAVGNATASASPSFWSVQDSTFVGRVAAFTSAPSGTATASMVSSEQTLVGSSPGNFTLRYKADFSGAGNASAQSFYVEVNLDHSLSGVYDQSLQLPVLGTSTRAGCFPGSQVSPPITNVQVSNFLVADGSWRTVTVPLGSPASSLGFGFQVKFCESMSLGFVGSMQLEVASAGVNITASSDGIVVPVVSSRPPTASIQPGPNAPPIPAGAKITGNLSFVVTSTAALSLQKGSSFTSLPSPSPIVRLNSTSPGVRISSTAFGILIATPFEYLAPTVQLNGAGLPTSIVSNDSVYASGTGVADAWLNPQSSATLRMNFVGYQLSVAVLDQSDNPVPGASVTVYPSGFGSAGTNFTGGSGVATLRLVPSTYSVLIVYQGTNVASGTVNLNQSSSETFRASVIQTTIRVNDALGDPLEGLAVTAVGSGSSTPIGGVTDQSGEFSFQAPLGSVYHVTVTSAGSTYYDGDITLSVNHAIIVIPTSYYSASFIERVVGAVVVIAVALALILMVLRRRGIGPF